MITPGALLVALSLAGAVAHAQQEDRSSVTGADQLSRTVSGLETSGSQISRGAALDAGGQTVDRSLPETRRPAANDSVPPSQLTGERGRADAGAQLSSAPPSAGPAASASARLAGMNTTVERPLGPDRCDPRADRRDPQICARIIETRSGDFPAPDPEPLSPEQRLLIAQRELSPMSRDVGTAARRLADGDLDESNAALAIASITLGQGSRPTKTEDEELPTGEMSVTDAIVAGVLAAVGQQQAPR